MSQDLDYARSRTDNIVKSDFVVPLMNNHKWVKVMQVLSDSDLVFECNAKLVWDESIRKVFIMNAGYCIDFYGESMESMISGYPKGFYDYKEVQWLELPSKAEVLANPDNLKAGSKLIDQDVDKIHDILTSLGQFELERCPKYLRLYGYK